MSAIYQIKFHGICICKQCWLGRWNKINFHVKGIFRAFQQIWDMLKNQ